MELDDDEEPVLAQGSNIHLLDGSRLGATARTEMLGEPDRMLVRYLLDVDV